MLACDDAALWELFNDEILEVISYSLSSFPWDCNFHVFLGMFFFFFFSYNIYKKMSAAGIIFVATFLFTVKGSMQFSQQHQHHYVVRASPSSAFPRAMIQVNAV